MFAMSLFPLVFHLRPSFAHVLGIALLSIAGLQHGSLAQELAVDAAPASAIDAAETFELPTDLSNAEECFVCIETIAAENEPENRSQEAMLAYQRKLARTVVQVVDKLLTLEPNDNEATQAMYFRLQALRTLSELDEEGADVQFQQAIEAARADSRDDIQAIGMKFLVENGFGSWMGWESDERQNLVDEIVTYLMQGEPDAYRLNTMLTVIDFLDQMQAAEHAKTVLSELLPHFRTSSDERILQMLARLEGTLRRLELPGNTIELSGTLLDGSELDWKSYQGKVVLVDFWATWCGPCRQEVPNILKLYKDYHEKGFDVVGISLDAQQEEAESYIEQYEIPWPNLFSPNEDERRWEHPMAVHYGITASPRAIMVDRKGKVISLQARGKTLAQLLRRLLGEPVARSELSEDALVQQVDTSR